LQPSNIMQLAFVSRLAHRPFFYVARTSWQDEEIAIQHYTTFLLVWIKTKLHCCFTLLLLHLCALWLNWNAEKHHAGCGRCYVLAVGANSLAAISRAISPTNSDPASIILRWKGLDL